MHELEERCFEIFARVCDLDPRQRDEILIRECVDDAQLLERLRRLCSAHDAESGAIDRDVFDGLAFRAPRPPDRIAGFRILGELGSGGMGVVYRAEQAEPRREVALKVLLPGMLDRESVQRFRNEPSFLARLQHPGIAQVYAAGVDPEGNRPWFAMELVQGSNLGEHVRTEQPGTRRRLELLIEICDAVDHAHQRAILHRDLKPGNVLVDRSGHVKVLDFGVARALDPELRFATASLGQQVLGTLQYMSPEQFAGDGSKLGIRSDIYSLGVLGYELLSGRLPYEIPPRDLVGAARTIRDQTPAPLRERDLKGDVETILRKAMEKEPPRRYASAAELADDLRRYLRHEPIVARPASTVYQLTQFARRNRALVVGVAASVILLLAGIGATSWSAVQARSSERSARKMFELLDDSLSASIGDLGADARVGDVLDRAAGKISGWSAGAPEIEVDARSVVGTGYHRLGRLPEARRELGRALEVGETALGPTHDTTLAARANVAIVQRDGGDLEGAYTNLARVVEARLEHYGEEDQRTLRAMGSLALLQLDRRKPHEAKQLLQRTLELQQRTLGVDHSDTLVTSSYLVEVLLDLDELEPAERLARDQLAVETRTLGADHPSTLLSANALVAVLRDQGKLEEAEILGRRTLDGMRKRNGDLGPDTLVAATNLGRVLHADRRYEEAEAILRDVVDKSGRTLELDHPSTRGRLVYLAALLADRGQHEEAARVCSDALASAERSRAPDSEILALKNKIARIVGAQDESVRAESQTDAAK